MARHSDMNLTMGIYSYVLLTKQSDAINDLPASSVMSDVPGVAEFILCVLKGIERDTADQIVDQTFDFACQSASEAVVDCPKELAESAKKPLPEARVIHPLSGFGVV